MSDAVTLDDVSKKQIKTVPIHARLAATDVDEVDKAANEQPVPVSRSAMIQWIVKEWVKRRVAQKKK